MSKELIEKAKEKFGAIIQEQLKRVEVMKEGCEEADYSKIIPLRHAAAARAKRHYEAKDRSCTEIYKIIECIDSEENRGQPESDRASRP